MKKLLSVVVLSVLVGGCSVATTMPEPFERTLRVQEDYRLGYNNGYALKYSANFEGDKINLRSYENGFYDGVQDRKADTYMKRYDYSRYNEKLPYKIKYTN